MSRKLIKKEFEVQWIQHSLGDPIRELTLRGRDFFDGQQYDFHLPEGIKFSDLTVFQGKRTRVTIEVVE